MLREIRASDFASLIELRSATRQNAMSARELEAIGVTEPSMKAAIKGARLLKRVEEWLAEQGCSEIWLTTDVDQSLRAYGFYISQGWKDEKMEDGLRYMTKDLGS